MVAYKKWSLTGSGRLPEVVAHRKWSFTEGSNCEALNGKILVFSIVGRLWEVVANESWSDVE